MTVPSRSDFKSLIHLLLTSRSICMLKCAEREDSQASGTFKSTTETMSFPGCPTQMQQFWRSSAYPSQRQPVCSTMPRRTLRSQPEANNARSREGRSSSATSGNSSSTPTHSRNLQNSHQNVFSVLMDLWLNMSRYKYTAKTSIFCSGKM